MRTNTVRTGRIPSCASAGLVGVVLALVTMVATAAAMPQDWSLNMAAIPGVVDLRETDETTIVVAVTHVDTATQRALVECPKPEGGRTITVSGEAVLLQDGTVVWSGWLGQADMVTLSYTVQPVGLVTGLTATCRLYESGSCRAESVEVVAVVPHRIYLPVAAR